VLGTLSFGYIAQYLGGMRNSVLALGVFFVIGFILLRFVKLGKQVAQSAV
jgi:MFS transporter, UMF1 family